MKKAILVVCCACVFAAAAPAQLTIGGAIGPAFGGGSFTPGFASGFGAFGPGFGAFGPGFFPGFGFNGFGAFPFDGFGFNRFGFGINPFLFRAARQGGRTTFLNTFPFAGFGGFPFGFGANFPFGYGGYGGYGYGYPGYPAYMPQAAPPVIVIGAPFGMAQPQPYRPYEAKPVTKEYKPGSLPAAPTPLTGPPPRFSIALTNNTIDTADAAWVQNGALYYISGAGAQRRVPLSQVDRSATERLNAQKGLTLWLPPVG